jgi:integrase
MKPFKVYLNRYHGVWIVKWREDGRHCTKQVPSSLKDKRDAEAWADAWWSARSVPGFCPTLPKDTFSSLCDRWIDHLRSKPNADERAWKDADSLKRLWIDPFPVAKVRIDRLTLADCVRWVEDVQRSGRADFTVRNVVQRARTMLADARGHGWYAQENWFADDYLRRMLKGCQPTTGADVIVHLPMPEAQKVARYRGEGVPDRRHARNLLALCTGLRAGELSGLDWSRVDLDAAVPHVRVDRQLTRERRFKDPKRKSFRSVPLHPLAVEAMRRWREVGFRGFVGRSPMPDDPAFPDAQGRFVYDSNSALYFRQDLTAYGCAALYEGKHPIDFHALRRSFMTLLNEAKVPEHAIKQLAGHAKQGVTRRSYIDGEKLASLMEAVMRLPFDRPAPPTAQQPAKVVSLVDRRRRTAR